MKESRSVGFLTAVSFVVTMSLLGIACGLTDGGEGGQQPRSDAESDGAVSNIDEVEKATVYIQARGGSYDQGREFGGVSYGQGTGFIIDPSGLAVTNNHVVTGAGYLEVYVSGEDEPRGAKILGASECSDLALIDIDEDGYPYLEWRGGEIRSNLDVRAAGFPATDENPEERLPDYTVTRGIVNTTEASGETNWASVESVIEHDALIRGGNSGGPLVDEEGKVVGVNYASSTDEEGNPTGQQQAIGRDEAQDIIEDLKTGDVDSIGINGEAYGDPETEFSGIAVISVKTGSPAGEAGIEGFVQNEETGEPEKLDIITKLEGTRLAENSTMEEYCKVLRGRNSPDQPLNIEVLRSTFDEAGEPAEIVRLEGELNGDPLKPVETILEPAEGDTASGDTASGDAASGFVAVSDDSGAITVEVPAEWGEVNGVASPIIEGEEDGPALTASPDIDGFVDTYEVPGVQIRASSGILQEYDEDTLLDNFDFSNACERDGERQDYDDGTYTGRIEAWTNCDGVESQEILAVAATPQDRSFMVHVHIQSVSQADVEAAQRILETFVVEGA